MQESPDKFTIEIPEVTNAQNELIKTSLLSQLS